MLLLLFSLVFYAWGEPLNILLMLFSIGVNYLFALVIGRYRARLFLVLSVVINLGMLGIFKYTGFLIENLNRIPGIRLPGWETALPIGISFYTFQMLSYVIDVYRKETEVQRDIFALGAYLAAFPQLIAGPIVRYSTVADELENRTETMDDLADGMRRFFAGLAKKVLIANTMAKAADSLFALMPEEYGAVGAWIAVFAYTMQIYFDFSGYSDMAIGMGRMMGFHYLENFNYPYIAKSVTDFWRRWHISLSTFFRDYVYIPLGGNRVSKSRWLFNIAVVWMLTGLWHGASWNFILWGVYFGVLLISEKLFWGRRIEKLPFLRHVCTMMLVVFGWVFFRSETLTYAGKMLSAMFGKYGLMPQRLPIVLQAGGVDLFFIFAAFVSIVLAAPFWPKVLKPALAKNKAGRIAMDISAVAALLLCLLSLAIGSYNPFIYFRF